MTNRIAFALTFLLGQTSIVCAEPPVNTLSLAERQAGWQLLFDGRTTDGWRNYRQDDVSDGWQVVDGALVCDGTGGDLITQQQYGSFELSLEYKISPGGNSGLMYHVTEEGEKSWHSGPEIQILDNEAFPGTQLAGWLYDLYPGKHDATRPAGEWNELRIRILPEQCSTFLNSVHYDRYVKGSAGWNERVARSKFAKYPYFGKATRGHICLQDHEHRVAFRNIKIRDFDRPDRDDYPVHGELPLKPVPAFPNLQWARWSPVNDDGLAHPLRPIGITHAGDGTNRLFVIEQNGTIHVFENRPDVSRTEVFLDIRDQTSYFDQQFERGLLGLAFHPKYAQNGEFFVCYTTPGDAPFDLIVSRFRTNPENPNRADPESEDVVLRLTQPYWNHNGGTVIFGDDGYLYAAFGDGGAANDPHENGQSLRTLLGKVLRIDVDRTEGDRPYAIPSDNPFVTDPDARGEIWAYGLRNIWRMAFDRQTGKLWGADVGQDLFEEINIIRRGGNYGWNLREGLHAFGARGMSVHEELIDPIWEYDHMAGASITGGLVYRGSQLPELVGHYLYADFVSGRIWALDYDTQRNQVVGNYAIPAPPLTVTSFGEDANGEVFFTVVTGTGEGIYRFEPSGG